MGGKHGKSGSKSKSSLHRHSSNTGDNQDPSTRDRRTVRSSTTGQGSSSSHPGEGSHRVVLGGGIQRHINVSVDRNDVAPMADMMGSSVTNQHPGGTFEDPNLTDPGTAQEFQEMVSRHSLSTTQQIASIRGVNLTQVLSEQGIGHYTQRDQMHFSAHRSRFGGAYVDLSRGYTHSERAPSEMSTIPSRNNSEKTGPEGMISAEVYADKPSTRNDPLTPRNDRLFHLWPPTGGSVFIAARQAAGWVPSYDWLQAFLVHTARIDCVNKAGAWVALRPADWHGSCWCARCCRVCLPCPDSCNKRDYCGYALTDGSHHCVCGFGVRCQAHWKDTLMEVGHWCETDAYYAEAPPQEDLYSAD